MYSSFTDIGCPACKGITIPTIFAYSTFQFHLIAFFKVCTKSATYEAWKTHSQRIRSFTPHSRFPACKTIIILTIFQYLIFHLHSFPPCFKVCKKSATYGVWRTHSRRIRSFQTRIRCPACKGITIPMIFSLGRRVAVFREMCVCMCVCV